MGEYPPGEKTCVPMIATLESGEQVVVTYLFKDEGGLVIYVKAPQSQVQVVTVTADDQSGYLYADINAAINQDNRFVSLEFVATD